LRFHKKEAPFWEEVRTVSLLASGSEQFLGEISLRSYTGHIGAN